MSNSVKCICVDDKNKPVEIPDSKWVKSGEQYHITHVFVMKNQKNIKGCEIAEFDISMHDPYNCYRLSRFAFSVEDLRKLFELISRCDELNQLSDLDIQKLVDDVPVKRLIIND
ncbi:MAG: hypothetical protein QM499_00850 [Flavobacteriaceae bacterium]